MKNFNFLPQQYKRNKKFKISHNYLTKQFADYKVIFKKIEKVIIDKILSYRFISENFQKL
jgi:hypothetical protein